MAYTPQLKSKILQDLAARVVARSKLSDVSEGSVLATILGAVAEEFERVEFQLRAFRDAFSLVNATGAMLDYRMEDFPAPGLSRLEAAPASGFVVISRTSTVDAITVRAGSTYGKSTDSSVEYTQSADASMGVGVATATVAVVATINGVASDAVPLTIDTVISSHSDITAVTNAATVGGGRDIETDSELIARAKMYISSLSRSQPDALRFLCASYTHTDGTRFRHVTVLEDVTLPGYTEILVDDGSGYAGHTREGVVSRGQVSANGNIPFVYHEAPAVEHIGTGSSYLKVNGVVVDKADYVSVPERGLLYMKKSTGWESGATWEVGGYSVYTDAIESLQRIIEGDPSDPLTHFGYRAAGTRVRVVPPTDVEYPSFQINVVVDSTVQFTATALAVKSRVVAISQALAPGKPLLLAEIYASLMDEPGVINTTIMKVNGGTPYDVYPSSGRSVVRVLADSVEVI